MSIEMHKITETSCPECGCSEIVAASVRKHRDGGQVEDVTFDCRYQIRYLPATSEIVIEGMCSKSARNDAWKKRRREIAAVMIVAAKDFTGRHDAYMGLLEGDLCRDLDMYRDDLEVIAP